jgi:hypothetical protein
MSISAMLDPSAYHANKETIAVSRFHPVSPIAIALGAILCTMPVVRLPAAAEQSYAACAKADLALIYKLADEHGTSTAAPDRLVQAARRMIEARAACRAGNYTAGLALYAEADALAGTAPR